jgi:hypothetical protein
MSCILCNKKRFDLAVGKRRVPDAGRFANHGQRAAWERFGPPSLALSKATLDELGDEIFELEAAQGRLRLELSKERIGQVKGGSHKSIFMRKCRRVKRAGRLRRSGGVKASGTYLAAIPLAFVSPWISNGLYADVAVVWLVPDRRIERVLMKRAEE